MTSTIKTRFYGSNLGYNAVEIWKHETALPRRVQSHTQREEKSVQGGRRRGEDSCQNPISLPLPPSSSSQSHLRATWLLHPVSFEYRLSIRADMERERERDRIQRRKYSCRDSSQNRATNQRNDSLQILKHSSFPSSSSFSSHLRFFHQS